jgi:tetratricopeptide (TPR) repeat protein
VAYSELGQYDLAIADYNAALRITPWSFEALWDRGRAYEKQGKLCEALVDLETALSIIRNTFRWRTFERARFPDIVEALRSQLGDSEGKSACLQQISQHPIESDEQSVAASETDQDALQSPFEPETWVWADWYGQAKTYNDTIGGQVIPNIQGWMCEVAPGHWGHTHENVVWFQLPGTTASRTAYKYVTGPWTGWSQVSWEHYYASAMGWEAYPPNNYFLLVPDRDICTGYNAPANWHKIHGQYWVN